MNTEYQKVLAELNAKMAVLKQVVDKLNDLESKFDEAKREKAKLDHQVILTKERLVRAEKLTSGLAGEHQRWKDNIKILDDRIRKLVGDIFISSAAISYYSPFTGTFRTKLIESWL